MHIYGWTILKSLSVNIGSELALEISKSALYFTKYEKCYMVYTIKMYDASTIEETFDLINTKDIKDLL